MKNDKTSVAIIGGGLAGLLAAAHLQDKCRVSLYAKNSLDVSNSMLAQGGVAVAIGDDDEPHEHFADTMNAGVGLNDPNAVQVLTHDGVESIRELLELGAPFDRDANGALQFSLEGAHSRSRVLHIGHDSTGKNLVQFVKSLLRSVKIHEQTFVTEILTIEDASSGEKRAVGVRCLDEHDQELIQLADVVILATGGAGGIYQVNANANGSNGDGIALAKRAGARLRDMEFVQFHPTVLDTSRANHRDRGDELVNSLITEALRGEGARLVNEHGEFIMQGVHDQGDLAPRDIIAREIFRRNERGEQVYLDVTNVPEFEQNFPSITAALANAGVDYQSTRRIPVLPGAHFTIGGVQTDLDGATTLRNLYAVGEVASTGVHGANRLASNSLLEIIVFTKRVAMSVLHIDQSAHTLLPAFRHSQMQAVNVPDAEELREKVQNNIGIIRNLPDLKDFIKYLAQFDTLKIVPDRNLMQAENIVLVAREIVAGAMRRTQSIGAHYLA
jgi:L-aspartate oxidase